jgi:DNA mismatch repair protein MutS2
MHAGALRALEFDRIVDAVRKLALTPVGAERLAHLRPLTEPRAVAAALDATGEAVAYLAENELPLRAPESLADILTGLAVEGRALEAAQLLGLATFLGSVEQARQGIRRARGAFPALRTIAEAGASFERELADIHRRIEPSGDVADDASPELRVIRERLRKQRSRLRTTLESFLRGRDTARYLQEQIVTDRNGRYVLVVRAEHRGAIPGIVHGSSTSGASLFLEPLSTVEINNEVVALEQQEREEVRRILLALTDSFRRRAVELKHTIEAAAQLDVVQARARLASIMRAEAPALAVDGRLELRAARHPLLIPQVTSLLGEGERDEGRRTEGPVPVDVLLIPPTRVLVITGPNTGGKTVALKTAGLLALMAQAGLHVPAAGGSQVPVFRSVFADIGDEQSIAANLSTFSWHVTNIAGMDRALSLPALVLLDEVGVGTDPVEGGALGMAIIEHFKRRGACVLATTHYDALKSYASTTEGVVCAAFGFAADTFAPTYRLNYGTPGSSLALEIAGRLGLPESIIEQARAHRSAREAQLAEHLARVERDLQALDHERRLAAREREGLTDALARVHAREQEITSREEQFRRRLDERLEERLREARREIDALVKTLKDRTDQLAEQAERRLANRGPGLSTGDTGSLRAEARASLDGIAERVRSAGESRPVVVPGGRDPAGANALPGVGDRVAIGSLGLEGVVQAVHDRDADVDVRGKRLRVRLDELRLLAAAPAAAATPRISVSVDLQPRDGSSTDLNVIGCSVDEALTRAEKFLDEAIVGEQRRLRVIHGHGTGQLRRAIADLLQTHPFVASFAAAPPEQGGAGVTVIELKE